MGFKTLQVAVITMTKPPLSPPAKAPTVAVPCPLFFGCQRTLLVCGALHNCWFDSPSNPPDMTDNSYVPFFAETCDHECLWVSFYRPFKRQLEEHLNMSTNECFFKDMFGLLYIYYKIVRERKLVGEGDGEGLGNSLGPDSKPGSQITVGLLSPLRHNSPRSVFFVRINV